MINENWYMSGIRVLMLLHRKKDGGSGSTDRKSIRRISRNEMEFDVLYNELREIQQKSTLPLRLYSSVNERNISKAIRLYKLQQVEIEFQSAEMQESFYIQTKNQFYSCLAKPVCAKRKLFLIDVDMKDDDKRFEPLVDKIQQNTEVVDVRGTANGVHFITKPFNPSLIPEAEIKKDAMILLDW